MTKLSVINQIATAIKGETVAANDIKSALNEIAAAAKGSDVKAQSIAEALSVISENIENIAGGEDIVIESERFVSRTTNGQFTVNPSDGYDAMAKVIVDVNVPDPIQAVQVVAWQELEAMQEYASDITLSKDGITPTQIIRDATLFLPGQKILFNELWSGTYIDRSVSVDGKSIPVQCLYDRQAAVLTVTFKFSETSYPFRSSVNNLIFAAIGKKQ